MILSKMLAPYGSVKFLKLETKVGAKAPKKIILKYYILNLILRILA